MAVVLKNYDCDQLYQEVSKTIKPMLLNDISLDVETDRVSLEEALYTKYNDTFIDVEASCDCGSTTGDYLLGTMCPDCETIVKNPFDKLENKTWMRVLTGVDRFINPVFWRRVDRTMGTIRRQDKSTKRDDILPFMQWLSDPLYNPSNFPVAIKEALLGKKTVIANPKVLEIGTIVNNIEVTEDTDLSKFVGKEVYLNGLKGFTRTYAYMLDNLEHILKKIVLHSKYRGKKREIERLILEYTTERDLICSEYLPVVSDRTFVVEKTASANFTDMRLGDLTNVVLGYVRAVIKDRGITEENRDRVIRSNMIATSRMLAKASEHHDGYVDAYLAHKKGVPRKNIYGSRSPFVFRHVVTPIDGQCLYNEIHVPWSVGLVCFKLHLFNKLVKDREILEMGWGSREVLEMLDNHITTYNPIIARVLQELIDDSPYIGLPVLGLRNPGLLPGSIQRQFITKFKSNPLDNTVSDSILKTSAMQEDYDKFLG